MNGVDHVEPHTAIPDAGRQAVGDRRPARDPFDAAGLRRRRQDAPSNGTGRRSRPSSASCAAATDYANLLPGVLSARVYLKQQNARVQTLLESCAEPLSMFASLARRALPGRRAAARVEDAAAEPSARQHLRLQHRRGARREHDAVRPRAAGRRRGGRDRARCDRRHRPRTAAGRRPRPRRQRRRTSNARRSSRPSSICRSTARSPGVWSTRRRSTGRCVLAARRGDHRGHRPGWPAASSFRCSAKSRSSATS